MRVIAGKARRLPLKTLESNATRPTTDRIKETLFNMINADLYDCEFLDLFSGSGAIGIEALSRDAAHVVFVENNKEAIKCIKENLNFTRLADNATVMELDAATAINKIENNHKRFDFIFMDPPYDNNIEKDILYKLKDSNIVDEDTTIIIEASLDTTFDYLSEYNFEMMKYKKYKTNAHVFLKKRSPA